MLKAWEFFIDLIFPPSKEELVLRNLSKEEFLKSRERASPASFNFIHPSLSYKDPLTKELIWQIKYKKNKRMIECGAFVLLNKLKEMNISSGILVPIPISKKRRRERGFNQCELLINEILRLDLENKFEKDFELITRSKHVEKQTLKDRKERLENTKDIFEVLKRNVKNRIILIDDVTTTGSTLSEAYNTLLASDYRDVIAVTIAH